MSVASTSRRAGPFAGNGSTTALPFTFKVFEADELRVEQTVTATGITTALTLNSNYTVSINADQNTNPGGTVTLSTALPTGSTAIVAGATAREQASNLLAQGGFFPETIDDALDRLTMIAQEQDYRLDNIGAELPDGSVANALGSSTTVAPSQAAVGGFITQLLSSVGSSMVGFVRNGTGAVARTVQAKLREIISLADYGTFAQYLAAIPTGFFSQNGANIVRAGRVMLGAAQRSDLAFPNVERDWFTNFQVTNGFSNGIVLSSLFGALNDGSTSETGACGGVFAIQSLNFASAGTNAIGISAHVVNNNATLATPAYGVYVEAHKTTAAAGSVYAIELDTRTLVASITPHPWQQGDVVGLQIASGAEFGSGFFDASVGIQFAPNPDKFKVGINFMHNSLTGASGGTGNACAIAMATGHQIRWYNSAGAEQAQLRCTTVTTDGPTLSLDASAFRVLSQAGVIGLDVQLNTSAVNYLTVGNNVAAASPYIAALGSDTHIPITLTPKGSATVIVAGMRNFANDAAAAAASPAVPIGGLYHNAGAVRIRLL